MTDIGSAPGLSAGALTSTTTSVTWRTPFAKRRPVSQPAQSACALLVQTSIAVLFLGVGLTWPGAIFLAIVLVLAAHAAVVATLGFHAAFTDNDRNALLWLRLIGLVALSAGILALTLVNGAIAIVPVMVGAWCAACARTAWLFMSGGTTLAIGLLLLTVGAQDADPIAFLAVQAASSGAAMIAISLPASRSRPTVEHWKTAPTLGA